MELRIFVDVPKYAKHGSDVHVSTKGGSKPANYARYAFDITVGDPADVDEIIEGRESNMYMDFERDNATLRKEVEHLKKINEVLKESAEHKKAEADEEVADPLAVKDDTIVITAQGKGDGLDKG